MVIGVLALQGDAAFGFAGMEVEVAVRHKMAITWVVFVNNGIGGQHVDLGAEHLPVGGFTPLASMTAVMASTVTNEGLKFPGRYPSAIRSGVRPSLFFVFQMRMSAPSSWRYWAMEGMFL